MMQAMRKAIENRRDDSGRIDFIVGFRFCWERKGRSRSGTRRERQALRLSRT